MNKWYNYDGPCPPNCEKRRAGCQPTCNNYINFRKRRDAELAEEKSRQNDDLRNYYRARKDKRLHAESRKSK